MPRPAAGIMDGNPEKALFNRVLQSFCSTTSTSVVRFLFLPVWRWSYSFAAFPDFTSRVFLLCLVPYSRFVVVMVQRQKLGFPHVLPRGAVYLVTLLASSLVVSTFCAWEFFWHYTLIVSTMYLLVYVYLLIVYSIY